MSLPVATMLVRELGKFDYDHEQEHEQEKSYELGSRLAIAPASGRRLLSLL